MSAPFTRLASDAMPADCEVVVIGSGFGASVAAARLAPQVADGDLVVLERGREWLPGEFPTEFSEVRSSVRTKRNPDGLFDLTFGRDIDSLVASGLGGGSLIYANVLLEPRPEVFTEGWPAEITAASMAPWFDRVRAMMRPETWQGPTFAKAAALGSLADAHGTASTRVPVAINLTRPEPLNAHGVVQPQCTLCGNCMTGCNVGAKGTLWTNYLPAAVRAGARLVTRVEVDTVAPSPHAGRRWVVRGRRYEQRGRRATVVPFEVSCDLVVLGAGAIGTTGILLRSTQLDLSPALGDRFSGNGDALAVAYNSTDRRTGLGAADQLDPDFRTGPTITEMVDLRTPTGGHLVQDGAIPHGIGEILRRILGARFALQRDQKVWCDIRAGGCPPGCGALEHSQVWLAMGGDGSRGRIILDRRGAPRVVWRDSGTHGVFAAEASDIALLSEDAEATLVANPRHALMARGKPSYTPITVHPLGGAVLADTADAGACDSRGRVFDGRGGVHAGLYVVDGALCPTSTGANPSLTIAALAERITAGLVADDLLRLRAGA
ncbi:cholesterol oxidase [Frondihabitans sp. PhB188]|uniref:GMC oxidoreductase n=1 Tax=Frondihabitans sp. PhB188 TaxID=2485200 RepID=UPI000F494D4D|nr:GMC oxidoreductase [Frondihabitans sp. PhB188]ROQ40069.1 cholesterol oxidase [Frondihabitans sp. PhB188]